MTDKVEAKKNHLNAAVSKHTAVNVNVHRPV